MAVERIKEFTIDLGDLIKTRLDSFVDSKQRIHATEEATFQRSVVDNDLSYQEQLDYRKAQLEKEGEEIYPDNEFISEVKTSISGLKKMVRYRKFRDQYFTLLTDLASGRKGLEDHLAYLQNSLADNFLDRDIKDELKEQYAKTLEAKRTQDRMIIDAQIEFNKKDRTSDSIDKAIQSVKSQLTKPDIQRDEALRTSYELQLATLDKEKMEIGVEDKMNWMAINLMTKDRKNPSLWKLETFSGFIDKGGNVPVSIGGVRYDSEKDYWQVTLNNYAQNDFGNEYVAENKDEGVLLWNKMGILPDSYLRNLITNNNIIRNHPELENFQIVIASAIQDSITNALALKASDLTAKYYLDKPSVATESDYQKAKSELTNLQNMFGEDYSLSPEIQRLETQLIEKRIISTQQILETAAAYAEAEGITLEEAITKYGPTAAVEISAETFKGKTPIEVAQEVAGAGKGIIEGPEGKAPAAPGAPATGKQVRIGGQLYPSQEWYDVNILKKKAVPTAPTPSGAIPTGEAATGKQVRIGGMLYPSQEWYDVNILKKKAVSAAPTVPTFDPAKYAKGKYTKYFQKGGQWYANVAGDWQEAADREKAIEMSGLKKKVAPAAPIEPTTMGTKTQLTPTAAKIKPVPYSAALPPHLKKIMKTFYKIPRMGVLGEEQVLKKGGGPGGQWLYQPSAGHQIYAAPGTAFQQAQYVTDPTWAGLSKEEKAKREAIYQKQKKASQK